jgi:hypothetical protein
MFNSHPVIPSTATSWKVEGASFNRPWVLKFTCNGGTRTVYIPFYWDTTLTGGVQGSTIVIVVRKEAEDSYALKVYAECCLIYVEYLTSMELDSPVYIGYFDTTNFSDSSNLNFYYNKNNFGPELVYVNEFTTGSDSFTDSADNFFGIYFTVERSAELAASEGCGLPVSHWLVYKPTSNIKVDLYDENSEIYHLVVTVDGVEQIHLQELGVLGSFQIFKQPDWLWG